MKISLFMVLVSSFFFSTFAYSTITEDEFNQAISKVEDHYAPVVASRGAKLKINRAWNINSLDASARRHQGLWTVNMFGGLARHPRMTQDGMSLVVCHEIGHHLGGIPKRIVVDAQGVATKTWYASEGQADYFATLKCFRRVFFHEDNALAIKKMNAPKALVKACEMAYADTNEKSLCIRSGMAGLAIAGMLAIRMRRAEPLFDTPSRVVVGASSNEHPHYQCRLDTFFQGALCKASMDEDVSSKDEATGTCHGSLGYTEGLRPLCWFKPSVE